MEIILIPLAIIAFFLWIPFGLARLTEAEENLSNSLSAGWKEIALTVRFHFGTSLFPWFAIIWVDSISSNQFISAITFVFVFSALMAINTKAMDCFRRYVKFAKICYFYAVFGVFICIFLFNALGMFFLFIGSIFWFFYFVGYVGMFQRETSESQKVTES